MANLEKIANVLDLAAEYVDQIEREKQAARDGAHKARLDKIASVHRAAHGEDLPDTVRQKLAKTDAGTLDAIEELLQKQAGAVDSLGGPVNDDPAPTPSIKEAADAADQRFLNWIQS